MGAYTYDIAGIVVKTGTDVEQFVEIWRNRERDRREAKLRAMVESQGLTVGDDVQVHDVDCQCGICQTNDRLGYDADVSDPGQYCKHGTFVGSWWGPDYMCGLCEAGFEPVDSWREYRAGKAARKAVKPRKRIGTRKLGDFAAEMIRLMENHEAAKDAWHKRTTDMPPHKVAHLDRMRNHAERAQIERFWGFAYVLTEVEIDWLNHVVSDRDAMERRIEFERDVRQIAAIGERHPERTEQVRAAVESFTDHYRRSLPKRPNPLAYYTPKTTARDAFERHDALRAWHIGIMEDMWKTCAAWLAEKVAEADDGVNAHDWLNHEIAHEFGEEFVDGRYANADMTPSELARIAGAYLWYRIDAWREHRATVGITVH